MSFQHLFSQSLAAAPDRLHFAAHSHHLWPDAALEAHNEAARDAARLADRKWERVMGDILPRARMHIADELTLPRTDSIAFAPNTHEFIVRMRSCFPSDRPLTILTTDGEFYSARRQFLRWQEAKAAHIHRVALEPIDSFAERWRSALAERTYDWVFASQVFFGSGLINPVLENTLNVLHHRPDWLIIDGYHGFMAMETDFSAFADRAFYLAGGYKYAMSGEGACFLHAPPGFGPRPVNTGWFAAFEALETHQDDRAHYAAHAGRFTGSTFDPTGFYRFVGVRDMLAREGLSLAAINDYVHPLLEHFEQAVRTGRAGQLQNAQLLAPHQAGPRARFLAYRHEHAGAWRDGLLKQNIMIDVRDDVIRFGFGLYQSHEWVDRLIDACADICR